MSHDTWRQQEMSFIPYKSVFCGTRVIMYELLRSSKWNRFLTTIPPTIFRSSIGINEKNTSHFISSTKHITQVCIFLLFYLVLWRCSENVSARTLTCHLVLTRVRDRFVIYWQNNDLLHAKTVIYNVKDRNSINSHYKISTA